ncbi:hypothetical protein EYF80_042465 [Liparis tanakae]|uniref:Uncharacterized protein n=1 Tax=Liparis tanakae TaxID=230148 RepID=A0A4Z2G1C2_9TELE|nr:hypothetical protein EYF80_042465 [Liparis tanakae]
MTDDGAPVRHSAAGSGTARTLTGDVAAEARNVTIYSEDELISFAPAFYGSLSAPSPADDLAASGGQLPVVSLHVTSIPMSQAILSHHMVEETEPSGPGFNAAPNSAF